MKNIQKNILPFLVIVFLSVNTTCHAQTSSVTDSNVKKEKRKKKKKYRLPKIDLSHWKVTLPIGKPDEVEPPEILDYANNESLKKYMYNDSTDGSLVFYAFPSSKTANTKYSRSELREQMVPGDNNVNWTFEQGGKMRGKLRMGDISKDKKGKYHKTIIMQIHGRLTNEQRDLIGQKDNNAPPILKIYWKDGKIRVKTKVLKNPSASPTEILKTDAWTDDEGYTFKEKVGFKKFILEVKVSKGKMVVSLNDNEFAVYKDFNIKRWGVFENYFKAGNYLGTKDKGAYAKVKYYQLEVSH
ncbi:polysaccharide lyase family 7 protein [Aquimarina sp. MMG016]|uniref:polysaccharide lyase family 7 protein n=1 Tax=Aquimarina sp. MMG016 TaxID=2822690 RepID=UPI001B3A0A41|nr:polysaccharide lyase family 7 protein [Aquimarina sp. MMG016]MBQ4821012.1 polysaccharide lyase family 7 protein [Aquimarina sp. MMG016]